jgi:hypothetical protein
MSRLHKEMWSDLPEMCVAILQPENVMIGIKRGQRGYFQMYDDMVKGETAKLVADRINKALHVTPQQREAMLCGSMMGWNCPAARPSSDLHAKAKPYAEENAP